ncbi:MAG: NAD(P)-dependent oxidoreductase [Planctomycetes bacterium]|nr:NAD(P)-dependent oxidoreductase [Planctomycetota bacterium]
MKGVLITGAGGFIGGYAVREFLREGWHVYALLHKNVPARLVEAWESGESLTLLKADVTDFGGLKTVMERIYDDRGAALDALVHCAGRASDVGRRGAFRKTNFESLQHLVRLATDFDVARFVFVSTTDVYGLVDLKGETEDELPYCPAPINPYPYYKIAAELWLQKNLPPHRFSIIRPAQVWGEGDTTLTPRFVDFLKKSSWIFHFSRWRGKNRWPLAHVKNVAAILFLAAIMDEAAGKSINVLDDERTTIDEFYRMVGTVFFPGKRFRTVNLPFWTGWLFGAVVTCLSNLQNRKHPITDPSLYALYAVSRNLDFSNKRFQKLMAKAGRKIHTLEQGMKELASNKSL